MNKIGSNNVFLLLIVIMICGVGVFLVTSRNAGSSISTTNSTFIESRTETLKDSSGCSDDPNSELNYQKITHADILSNKLVVESRALFIQHGFSSDYFDAHFELIKFNEFPESPWSTSIMWRFNVGEYCALVVDTLNKIGPDTRHAVEMGRAQFHDINTVLQRTDVEKKAISCLGEKPKNEAVTLELILPLFEMGGKPNINVNKLIYSAQGSHVTGPPPGSDMEFATTVNNVAIDLETGKILICQKN